MSEHEQQVPVGQSLQALYDSEINWRIDTFWDSGFRWYLGLGDNVGTLWDAEGEEDSLEQSVAKLVAAALEHYPNSTFAIAQARPRVPGQIPKVGS